MHVLHLTINGRHKRYTWCEQYRGGKFKDFLRKKSPCVKNWLFMTCAHFFSEWHFLLFSDINDLFSDIFHHEKMLFYVSVEKWKRMFLCMWELPCTSQSMPTYSRCVEDTNASKSTQYFHLKLFVSMNFMAWKVMDRIFNLKTQENLTMYNYMSDDRCP